MSEIDISLLLPTRGRPERLHTFLDSIRDTTQNIERVEIILFVDNDDRTMLNFERTDLRLKKIIEPRNTMGYYNTACFNASSGELVIAVNDDIIVRTHGWDTKLMAFHHSQPQPYYLAYPNDLYKNSKFPTFPILPRETMLALSSAFPEIYKGAFLDTHLLDIFLRLKKAEKNRIFFLKEIIFEHMHFRAKKSPKDSTYLERDRFGDDATFVRLTKLRKNETLKLLNQIDKKNRTIDNKFQLNSAINPNIKFVSSLWSYFTKLFLDKTLPFNWRAYLFYYFAARAIFKKIVRS